MATVSTYLNFKDNTEEVFEFYRSIFWWEFVGGILRMEDAPKEGMSPLLEKDKKLVMHVALEILGGHKLMWSDIPESMGAKPIQGNNVYINLEPDTRKEAERLFNELSAGGKVEMPLEDVFWESYFGSFIDKYGTCWMINCYEKK